ncbi:hypothetical protein I4U23_008182 [Adineta vaga]|nr:hypothetical protein I4U23_008182 [Adineta vaga]
MVNNITILGITLCMMVLATTCNGFHSDEDSEETSSFQRRIARLKSLLQGNFQKRDKICSFFSQISVVNFAL